MRERMRQLLHQRDFLTLALLAIVIGTLWIFVELADELREGQLQALDTKLLYLLRSQSDITDPIGPRWFEELMRDASALGSVIALTLLGVAVVTTLWMEKHREAAIWLTVAILGALTISSLFKLLFARERPDILAAHLLPSSYSFPSGHAFLSAAVYLTIAALLTRIVPNARTRLFILVMALLVTFLIGFSRVYLGVHYPSDVLAGWTLGLSWAALCWLVVSKTRKL